MISYFHQTLLLSVSVLFFLLPGFIKVTPCTFLAVFSWVCVQAIYRNICSHEISDSFE